MSRERRQMSIRMEPYIQLAFILVSSCIKHIPTIGNINGNKYSDACWYFKDAAATI